MSWKEFKKKKEQEEATNTNTSIKTNTTTTNNTSKMSSWQKFKLEKENNSSNNTSSWQEFKNKKENKTTKLYQDEKEKEDTWFTSGKLFDDGYQFGDISGTVVGTVGDVGINVAKGIAGLGEGIGDAVSYGIADVYDWTGNDRRASEIRTRTQKNVIDSVFAPAEDYLDKYSVLGEKSDSISEGLGYVAGIASVGYFTGGLGVSAVTFTNGMANGMSEALNSGASIDEARMYGAISGVGEAASELMFGGLGKASKALGISKGALDDVIVGGLTKNIKNKMVKTIMQSGLKATGEGLEEIVSGLISAVGKKATYMSDKELSKIVKDENLAEQFWMGTLTSAIIQGPSTRTSIKNRTDYITGRTHNEQKVYDNEVQTRTNEKAKQATIEQSYDEQIKTQENLGVEITEELKSEIRQKVEKAYLNGTLQNVKLNKNDLIKIEEQVENDMQEGNISADNIKQILGENQDISRDKLLMKSMYENEQKYNSYKVEQTNNEKVNILMQSAADAGMNNTNKTRKKVELISKLVKDTDRQYKFVSPDQLKALGYNENANGLINKSTGEILINAHSDKGLQSIVGHETTHIFDSKNQDGKYSKEYQTLQDMAIEYAKVKGIYDNKVQSITSAYGNLLADESQIKEELTADLVGDFLFNDEKFIENLAVKNRNVFQKIYDYIKHIYKVVTSGTDEAKALENLKYQFDKVYKTVSEERNSDTKYSFVGINAQNANKSKLSEAVKLEEQGKSAQEIYEKTGWYRGNENKWRFEIDDSNFNIYSDLKIDTDRLYELHEILDADKLYDAYPDLYNTEVVFDDLGKTGGYYDAREDVIYLNSALIKDTDAKSYEMLGLHNQSDLFSVLNHEIQHWIQHYEEFSNGSNPEYWKKQNENKMEKAKRLEQDLNYYQEKIGYKEYHEELLDKLLNGEITGEEYTNMIDKFIDNSEYAEQIKKTKEMYDKIYPTRYEDELYRNTAGEQEAQNVQERIKMSSEEKAKTMPFIKDEYTVYTENDADIKYSIGGKESLKNIKDSKLRKQAYDTYKKAKQMAKNKESNEKIFKETGWYKDKVTGKMKFNFSDKDMKIVNRNYKVGQEFKLEDLLVHKTLFEMYPQLRTYKVKIEDMNQNKTYANGKLNGRYNRYTNEITIDINRFKNISNADGTLIHEIQHAIQKIEGFAGGTSIRFGKEKYRKNPGEIEARDTAARMMQEKYNNKDLSNVIPKSAHVDTTILEKMKIGLYNYLSGINNEEEYNENTKTYQKDNSSSDSKNNGLVLGGVDNDIIKESENNSGSFSLSKSHDNQGKSLSQEQEEYFKNSKSRDKDGKLKRLYHGTPYQFDIFNYSKLGENTSSLGAGFYFSDNKATGEEYARGNGNVKEVYVNITKPLSYGKTTMTKAEYKRLVEAVNKETNGSYLEDYGGINEALMEYEYGGDDIDLVNAIHNASGLTWEKTYDILRKKTGFDGIISEQDFLNKGETIYVAFNSDQIKNIDNMTPTSNPNINLSLTNDIGIIGDDIAVKDLQREEKVTIEDEIINTAIEVPTVEDVITQTEEQKKQGMKDKAKKYLSRSKTKFINKIVNDFGTSKIANTKTLNSVVDRIREDIQQNGSLTKEKTDSYFNELYDNLVKIDSLYYDEYKEVKDNIRNTKLYISDSIKDNITDYNDFKKSNIGTLLMTSDSNNIAVDSYYQELSGVYPELFPEDILNPADQLSKISEVAKYITKVETNVAAYNDKYLGPDYRSWARASFDKDINDFTQDIKLANRYNMATDEKSKIGVDKEIVKYAYKQLPVAKKTYEKAISKELLTKEDRLQVNRLLNNEISPQDIPNVLNKKGIIKVAEAKLEYDSLQKAIKEYQTDIKSKRIEDARNDIGNLDLWKDKNIGFKYSRETPIRNIYDIAPKEIADNIVNKYFRSYIEVNEKKVIDAINGYNDRIKQLDIGTKNKYEIRYMQAQQDDGNIKKEIVTKKVSESALVQLLGENKITVDEVQKSGADVSKIQNAVNEFRNIYNELIEQINESMLDNGYAPVEYRKDYFPHFTEEKVDTLLGKAAKLLGIDITNREELPTDIAGQTYQFKPGRTWFGNILQRTIDVTDYDALKGFDKYIRGATDLIYHTGDIQNLRALSTAIRGTYNDVEIQNKIEEIKESTMSDLDKASAIQEVYNAAKDKSHLSKFIEWLDNYTNLLAGKKAINDRGAEKELNRQVYKTMQDVESRIAANAIGGNIGVSLTNFAPLSQAWGEIKTTNLINGIWQTMKASLGKDTSFASESQFVTRRRGTETLSETTINKLTKPLNNILQFADDFTSEVIVRSRYNQNLQEGMSAEVALEEADRYAAELMGDRGRGALPTQFSNKNPISKMINMFQVEVNNQWSYYLKDLPKNIRETANANKTQVVANTAMAYTKIMIGAYLTNELLGSIRGQSTRVLPDPIYIIAELLKGLTDDDDENDDDAVIETITEIAGNVPFISLPATLVADSLGLEVRDIGRVSISGAIPNISDITSDVFDVINGEKTLGEGAKSIGGELLDTVGASLALPYGGSQIKKTVKGLSLYSNDIPGSYTDSGDLRYTVEDDVGSKVQAAIFGAYANPYAQDYIDSGFKTISKDNIDEMVGLDMNSSEYRDYKKGLNKFNKTEEKLNYINSLDLTDSQKTLAANNINKNSKKTIDMSEYGNYSSYDEYKYARDNPEKYNLLTQITDYDNYVKYKDDIADIKKKYSTEAGYDSNERKSAVQSYINSLELNQYQKMMLEKMAGGYSIKDYQNYIYEYLETTNLSKSEKYAIWEELFN